MQWRGGRSRKKQRVNKSAAAWHLASLRVGATKSKEQQQLLAPCWLTSHIEAREVHADDKQQGASLLLVVGAGSNKKSSRVVEA